jgi:hypothetical protein
VLGCFQHHLDRWKHVVPSIRWKTVSPFVITKTLLSLIAPSRLHHVIRINRQRELRPLVPEDYQVKIIPQEKYAPYLLCFSLSLDHSRPYACTEGVNVLLLCLAQFLVSGEEDLSWRPALISRRCVLRNRSTRRWGQHDAVEDFSTEELVQRLSREANVVCKYYAACS